MKVRFFFVIAAIIFLFIGVELFYNFLPITFERTDQVMGTTVRIKVRGPASPYLTKRAIYEIKRLEKIFSFFRKDSEISLINSLAGKAPLQVSLDTFKVLKMAVEVNRLSKGAFDVTLGHARDLELNEKLRKVYLKRKGVKIDLGGIGKGYAVELSRQFLMRKGVKSAIIDMHSSIAVIGGPWRVGVIDPRNRKPEARSQRTEERNQKLLGVVSLNDGEALSTSGQYEQPGHIIDPRTGSTAVKCLSVTIVGKNAGFVDALSTAVFVLGPMEGMKLVQSLPSMEALVVDKQGRTLKSKGLGLL